MRKLRGVISDRIRGGEIPPGALTRGRLPTDESPKSWAVRAARGVALGAGHKRDGTGGEGIRD